MNAPHTPTPPDTAEHFVPLPEGPGFLYSTPDDDPHPHSFWSWRDGFTLELKPSTMEAGATNFGYVQSGVAFLTFASGPLLGQKFKLTAGMYFACPWDMTIRGGQGFVVCRHHRSAPFHLGGPIEPIGRLRYIDGCTDSLLVPPWKLGEACFNHLHFPAGIAQTRHTHPSNRIGIVTKGRGRCVVPDANGEDISIPLDPGRLFVIPKDGQHSFFTDGPDECEMDVIAFHPDSDFGPQDEDHPMLNRTWIDGEKANEDIRSGKETEVFSG